MSLACLTCQTVQRTHSDLRSYSFSSQDEEGHGSVVGCWYNKKSPQPPPAESNTVTVRTRVVPVPSGGGNINSNSQDPVSPRLTRCHAVRRDIFRDWHFEDFRRK